MVDGRMSDTSHCDLAAMLPDAEPVLVSPATDTGLAKSWLLRSVMTWQCFAFKARST